MRTSEVLSGVPRFVGSPKPRSTRRDRDQAWRDSQVLLAVHWLSDGLLCSASDREILGAAGLRNEIFPLSARLRRLQARGHLLMIDYHVRPAMRVLILRDHPNSVAAFTAVLRHAIHYREWMYRIHGPKAVLYWHERPRDRQAQPDHRHA